MANESIFRHAWLLIDCILYCLELSKFLETLDKRAKDSMKESKKYTCERKQRVVCSPTKSVPCTNAPKWTISKEWLKGT